MKSSAPLLVLTLAVGLALGLFAGATLFTAAPQGPTAVARAASAGAPGPAAPGVALSTAEDGGARPAARAVDRGPSPADLERAAGVAREVERTAAPLDASVAGDGVVTGRVEAVDGSGLPGALVRLEPRGGDEFVDPASELEDRAGRSLEELMADAAREALEARRGRREVRTDATGGFRFEGLPEGRWRVTAHLDGHRVRATTPNAGGLPTGSEVLFRAEPYRTLEVALARADGAPVEEAVIEVRTDQGRQELARSYRWTSAQPALHLPPGGHFLTAHAELLPIEGRRSPASRWKSEPHELFVDASAPGAVTLLLEPTDLLFGEVRFAPRFETVESLRLIVQGFTGETPPTDDQLARNGGEWISGERGYAFEALEPGRYLLAVTEGWNGPVITRATVDYAGGVQRQDLWIERSDSQEIALTVLNPEGRPVVGAELSLRTGGGRRSRASGLGALFRDGAYRFPLPEALADGLDEDEVVEVELRDARYAPAAIELRPGVLEYTLQAEAPATVVVLVSGFVDEDQRRRLRVSVEPVEGTTGPGARGDSGAVDPLGRFESDGLQPGRYRVSLQLNRAGRGWGGRQVESREVTIATGENPVALGLPPLHDFRVTTPEHGEGTWFMLTPLDGDGGRSGRFGGDGVQVEGGELRFTEVLAGRYRLAPAGRDDQAGMELSVPCSDFTFESRAPDAVEVEVRDDDGRLARIGLATGDLLLEIDGVDLSLPSLSQSADALLLQTTGRHRVRFLRGGEAQSLEWDAAALGGDGSLGGRLRPTRIGR